MSRKLFVGNLPFSTTDHQLAQHFADIGTVEEASVITDRETGRARGFGFVTMATPEDAQRAITQLDQTALGGLTVNVNMAQPRNAHSFHSRSGDRQREHRGTTESRRFAVFAKNCAGWSMDCPYRSTC